MAKFKIFHEINHANTAQHVAQNQFRVLAAVTANSFSSSRCFATIKVDGNYRRGKIPNVESQITFTHRRVVIKTQIATNRRNTNDLEFRKIASF